MRYVRYSGTKGNHIQLITMDTHIPMEERLWDYIDGLGNQAERSEIQTLIAENIEWQQKYKELLNMHQLLDATELEAPSMRFTKNVMEEIARHHIAPATKSYVNKNIIRSIGAAFLTLIAGFLVYCLGQFKWSAPPTSSRFIPRYDLGLDTAMKKYDWSRVFNSAYTSAYMLVLVVLGLVMLDMYLQRKKQQRQEASS